MIERVTGRKPRGWRAPLYNFSNHSADLLVERGFVYDSSLMGDDIPYLLEAANGRLVELPSHWGMDDWPQFVQSFDLDYMMPVRAPRTGFEIFKQEFDVAYKYGGLVGAGGSSLCHRPAFALACGCRVSRRESWRAAMSGLPRWSRSPHT